MEAGKNAITLTQANNSDLLRALKHLMETRLYETDNTPT